MSEGNTCIIKKTQTAKFLASHSPVRRLYILSSHFTMHAGDRLQPLWNEGKQMVFVLWFSLSNTWYNNENATLVILVVKTVQIMQNQIWIFIFFHLVSNDVGIACKQLVRHNSILSFVMPSFSTAVCKGSVFLHFYDKIQSSMPQIVTVVVQCRSGLILIYGL